MKEYLTPKDLSEKGLSPVLDAMEVIDYSQPMLLSKKRLLRMLWPDSPFEARFGKFIQQRGFYCIQFSTERCLSFVIYSHRNELLSQQ